MSCREFFCQFRINYIIAVVNTFVSLIISGLILNRTGIDYTPIYDRTCMTWYSVDAYHHAV